MKMMRTLNTSENECQIFRRILFIILVHSHIRVWVNNVIS